MVAFPLTNIIAGINATRNFSANDKQKFIPAITKKQREDSGLASGGSVDAINAVARAIKNEIQKPGIPSEPVAAQ